MAKMQIVFEDVTRDDGSPGIEIDLVRVDGSEDETIATQLAGAMMLTIEAMINELRQDGTDE